MEFDDIIIGSGLSALGVAWGLAKARSVLVVCGPATGQDFFYDGIADGTPCAAHHMGGLGNYWHGVIPTGLNGLDANHIDSLLKLFSALYPKTDLARHFGHPGIFVPWKPIRPKREWSKIRNERGANIRFADDTANRIQFSGSGMAVTTPNGRHKSRRVWVCGGALLTPKLLDASFERPISRGVASDHVICYLGQIKKSRTSTFTPPKPKYCRDGAIYDATYSTDLSALCMLRPAHFDSRKLDYGIEQRAVFGLPTGSVIAKLSRRASPGLLTEALYNRFGLFSNSQTYNVYAQVSVPDAYDLQSGGTTLITRRSAILSATSKARIAQPFSNELIASHRPDLYLPGVHLHNTLNASELTTIGANSASSPLQIVDASVLTAIGPDHHSFRMMAAATARAHES